MIVMSSLNPNLALVLFVQNSDIVEVFARGFKIRV